MSRRRASICAPRARRTTPWARTAIPASLAPALSEALDLPFSGNDSRSLLLTGDKLRCKRMLRDAGLPTPEWRALADLAQGRADLPGIWILKPVAEDASAGLSAELALAEGAARAEALHARPRPPGTEWFAERYIEGREINVALLQGARGPRVLPVAEIRFLDFPPGRPRILDYAAKWEPESFAYRHTPRHFDSDPSEAPLLDRLAQIGRACWDLFGLAGYARVLGCPTLAVQEGGCRVRTLGANLRRFFEGLRQGLAQPLAPRRKAPKPGPPVIPLDLTLWREDPRPSDLEAVRSLVAAADVFSTEEVTIAAELVQERLARGADYGYWLIFSELPDFFRDGDGKVMYVKRLAGLPCALVRA